jgi:hypothetical protein
VLHRGRRIADLQLARRLLKEALLLYGSVKVRHDRLGRWCNGRGDKACG